MRTALLVVLLAILLSGCLGLPTLQITPTIAPTIIVPTAIATSTPLITIEIIGDVYVRNSQDQISSLLHKGARVQAICAGDWCVIVRGKLDGMKFWRGCGNDNPGNKRCQPR